MPNLNINVTANTSQAQGNLKGLGTSFTEIESAIKLATRAMTTIGQVAQKAFALGKEGAQLKDTTASLLRLAEGAGVGADLLARLETAAGGTVDDLAYMGSTIRLLTGETGDFATALANAAPQLLIIARAAVKLNPTLGTTAEAYEAITRAIETGQTRALKNYGIVLEDTENKQDALNQILAQGGVLIEQVGGSVETATDDFTRFENALDNLKDAGSLLAADFLTPTIVGLGEVTASLTTGENVWSTYWSAVGEFNSGIAAGVGEFFGGIAMGIEETAVALVTLTPALEQTSTGFSDMAATQAAQVEALQAGLVAYDELGEGLANLEDHYAHQHIAIQEQIADFAEADEKTEAFQERVGKLAAEQIALTEAMQASTPTIDEMLDSLDQDIGSPLTAFISDLKFFIASGGADFKGALEDIQGALADNAITPEQAEQFGGELLAVFENAKVAAGEIDFTEAGENVAAALGIPIEEAEALLLKFTDIETAKASLSEGIALNIETERIDAAVVASGILRDELINLDDFEVAPNFQPTGIEETKDALVQTNTAAMQAEETIGLMVQATGGAAEGAAQLEPLTQGLTDTEKAALNAEAAIKRMIAAAAKADFSNLEPVIAESPAPLALGLQQVAEILPEVIRGLDDLGELGAGLGRGGGLGDLPDLDAGGLGLRDLFEKLAEDAENFTENLFEAADAFGALGNAAADLFQQNVLDPLEAQAEDLGSKIDLGIGSLAEQLGIDDLDLNQLRDLLFLDSTAGGSDTLTDAQARQAERILEANQERADILAKIAEEEERILKLQEQQQKLAFLQQKFEFIQFLQDQGLNPADFLSGVNTNDPAALIDAMNDALTALLAKLGGGMGFAQGANFVVPPGYPGDSFGPLWATSGEPVLIGDPARNMMCGGGQVVINMAGAIIMSQQEADRLMRSALDRAGGRADIYRRGM